MRRSFILLVTLLMVGGFAVGASGANENTLTSGYWATHSVYGPASQADDGWYTTFGPYPPGVDGPDALLFDSGLTWYEAFHTPPRGNAWFILAPQWMAAYLNYYNGAGSGGTEIVQWLVDGALLLDIYDQDGGPPLIPNDSPDRPDAIDLAETLLSYNES